MLEGDLPDGIQKKSLSVPDEIQISDLGQTRQVVIGNTIIRRRALKPGWSEDVTEIESFAKPYIQVQLTGKTCIRMNDGTVEEFRPGDVGLIPPGHNNCITGNKIATILEIAQQEQYIWPKTETEIEEERTAIRTRAEDFITALNTKNSRHVASFFADNAVFFNTNGRIIEGRPAIERYFETYLRDSLPSGSLFKIYGGRIRPLGSNISDVDLYINIGTNRTELLPATALVSLTLANKQNILVMRSADLTESQEEGEIGTVPAW